MKRQPFKTRPGLCMRLILNNIINDFTLFCNSENGNFFVTSCRPPGACRRTLYTGMRKASENCFFCV